MSPIWIRLLVSPVLLGIVFGVLWLHDRTGSYLPTDLFLLLAGGVSAAELVGLLRASGRPTHFWVPVVGSALLAGVGLFASAVPPEGAGLRFEVRTGLVAAAFLLLLLQHARDTRPAAVEQIAVSLVPLLFVGLLLSYCREVGVGPRPAWMLAWVVLVAKASDMGGWLVGKPFGRHKLIPSVSPGKSWEGLAGGLAGSVLVAVFVPPLLDLQPVAAWSTLRLAGFGVAVGGASVLAGIAWSAWKRRLGAKDSSRLLPEIGGVVDMVDSMLLAGPVAWAWLRLGL